LDWQQLWFVTAGPEIILLQQVSAITNDVAAAAVVVVVVVATPQASPFALATV
jgi:hypothetical protein